MKKHLRFLLGLAMPAFLLVLLNITQVLAQTKLTVNGKIVDQEGKAVPGATVAVVNTKRNTTSDADGNFIMVVDKKDAVLKISSVGYHDMLVNVQGRIHLEVKLMGKAADLDEVVVVGYGSQRKKEVTGAVGSVKADIIEKTATSDIGAAIQGQIAGVNVIASDGAPGSVANIQIRGVTSVNGNNSPLYVVDGIPYDGVPNLSPTEIEKIDVLKDGASAAVYGTRAASGVILITTKQGKPGQMKVSLDSYYGIQKITSGIGLMDLNQFLYALLLVKRQEQRVLVPPQNITDDYFLQIDQNPKGYFNNTDWLKELQVDNAPTQNYSLRMSGGKQELLYNLSLNHFEQQGVLINSKYQRSNVRATATFKKDKFTMNSSMGLDFDNRRNPPFQLVYTAIRTNPYYPGINALQGDITSPDISNQNANLGGMAKLVQETNANKIRGFNGAVDINYQVTNFLGFKIRAGGNVSNNLGKNFQPKFNVLDSTGAITPYGNATSTLLNSNSNSAKWTTEYSANYNQKFGNHSIQLLGLFSMEQSDYKFFSASNTGILSNSTQVLNASTGVATVKGTDNTRTLVGSLARLQYNYSGRYLLSASVRRDGSSRFASANQYAIFPGVSAGWNISDEKFWTSIAPAIESLKFRASYAQVGYEGIGNYMDVATVATDKDYVFGSGSAEVLGIGLTQINFANSDIKWETSISKNIGFDAAFLKGKLSLNVDAYNIDKKDMLFAVSLPPSTGGGSSNTVLQNIGNMTNKGIEIALGYHDRVSKDFTYDVTGTFTRNRNMVTKTAKPGEILYSGRVIQGGNAVDLATVITAGYPAGSFFLVPTDGILRTDKEVADYKKVVPTAQIGDLRWVDTNGDGKITDADRVFHGSGAPKFELGLNLNASYKNVDISVQIYGSFGAKVINGAKVYAYQYGTSRDLVYQWSPQNPNTSIPTQKINGHPNNRAISDYFLEDGTYVRLRNISAGYALPSKMMKKAGISKTRFYLSAQNLITLTKYTGFDPEVGNDGINSRGIDQGNYPVSSLLRAGVQLEF